MKIIDIPEPVKIRLRVRRDEKTVEEVEETVSFDRFLKEVCDGYEQFAKGPAMARQYDKIMRLIEAVDGQKALSFEDADFEIVKTAVASARWITPAVNRAYLPFYAAVDKAQDVEPAAKK